jgi:hypothetical protein
MLPTPNFNSSGVKFLLFLGGGGVTYAAVAYRGCREGNEALQARRGGWHQRSMKHNAIHTPIQTHGMRVGQQHDEHIHGRHQ